MQIVVLISRADMKIETLSDEEIVARHFSGMPGCFDEIYRRYEQKVYFKCLTLTGDKHLAQDLCHDIFIKVFSKLHSFTGQGKFSLWLRRIAINYCYDYLKSSAKTRTQSFIKNDPESEDHHAEFSAEGIWSDRRFDEEEYHQALNKSIAMLTPEDRLLLLMRYQDGHSIDEIAIKYGKGVSAVKMRLHRIRIKLGKQIKQALYE